LYAKILPPEPSDRIKQRVLLNKTGLEKFERGESTTDLGELVRVISSLKVISGNPRLSLHVELARQDLDALRRCVGSVGEVVEYAEFEAF
jgi:hypothetical protein